MAIFSAPLCGLCDFAVNPVIFDATPLRIGLAGRMGCGQAAGMFSHVVIFWTDPAKADAVDALVAGAEEYLRDIPGSLTFHVGRMVGSERPVVDQSYQVALNIIFTDKEAQDAYQIHPRHVEFVEKVFKPNCTRVQIFDFA